MLLLPASPSHLPSSALCHRCAIVQAASTIHLHRTLNQIKSMGCMAGVVLNPGTPLSQIEYVLSEDWWDGMGCHGLKWLPKWGIPKLAGWFISWENPIEVDDLGVPLAIRKPPNGA